MSQVLEHRLDPPVDLVVDGRGQADAADLGELLDARGDVDAVAEDVAILENDVAEIDADAEFDARSAATSELRRRMRSWISIDARTASATL